MKTILFLVSIAFCAIHASAADGPKSMYVIPSWGDIALVHGPGTDVAMDSEQAMENTLRHWKGRGFTGVFLRTDLIHMPPGSIIRHPASTQPNPRLAVFWHTIDEILARCDPQMAAREAAAKVGFEHWVSHPHIYSEGAPSDIGVPGVGRMVPWSYARKYHVEHPEVITVDRQGNRQWMVPEYAYPGARADKVVDFAYIARTYHPTGIIASMRSEASQLLPPPGHGDQYGFNQPVVDDMKRLYGVDIMTDPRFDWKSEQFNLADPMVENWRTLRGSYLTQLYREIRDAIRKVDPKIQFGVTLSGQYVGPVLGNWRLAWRTWVDEGLVDVILVPVTFEATYDHEADKKGYLTDARHGKGTVSATEISQYIAKSRHPQIRVIHTGSPSYFYPPPPDGSDGWQCDVWYDVYHVAWYQRWEQWKRDLSDFGYIKFFEQNFDAFPLRSTAISGGWGDGRHNPDLRSTPGVWSKLGDGSDGKAVVQEEVRRGDVGRAVLLTRDEFVGLHHSAPDRSRMTGMLDNSISNGKGVFQFWINRDNAESGLTVLFTGDNINTSYTMTGQDERDVGLRIEPGTGRVWYASGKRWIQSDVQLPAKQWRQLSIDVDADSRTYAAYTGPRRKLLCSGIKYAPPGERFVEQHGVNIPIKVPSYRAFNTLNFIPAISSNNRIYLDDVTVKWTPTTHYTSTGSHVLVNETFETAEAGAIIDNKLGDGRHRVVERSPTRVVGRSPDRPAVTVEPADQAEAFFIERTTSFGPGVKCVRATGGGALVAETTRQLSSADGMITVDLDVFVRSDRNFPYIIPNPKTRSKHSVALSLDGAASGQPLAAVDSADGTWQLWDGQRFVDSGKLVTYDVWNHLQIAVNPRTKTYRFVVQPVGELPTVIGDSAVSASVGAEEKLKLSVKPSATAGHISCYDNILVTCN